MREVALLAALLLPALMVSASPALAHRSAGRPVRSTAAPRAVWTATASAHCGRRSGLLLCAEVARTAGVASSTTAASRPRRPDLGFYWNTPGSGERHELRRWCCPRVRRAATGRSRAGLTNSSSPRPSGSASPCATTRATPRARRSVNPTATATSRCRRDLTTPGPRSPSCSSIRPATPPPSRATTTHWCVALTIDSLQAQYGALHGPGSPPNAITNPNCPEPVNFAFLTHSGTPVGPPGPDQQTDATFTPTPDVLVMNSGDKVKVTMLDTPVGYSHRGD